MGINGVNKIWQTALPFFFAPALRTNHHFSLALLLTTAVDCNENCFINCFSKIYKSYFNCETTATFRRESWFFTNRFLAKFCAFISTCFKCFKYSKITVNCFYVSSTTFAKQIGQESYELKMPSVKVRRQQCLVSIIFHRLR